MSRQVQIGEAVRLLGLTSKTIRHWERLGLLRSTQRTSGGYRTYAPVDLLRLQRIQRLQGLGLSLRAVKGMLGTPEHERPWREVLMALRADIAGQIDILKERHDRIATLLEAGTLDAVDVSPGLPPTLRRLHDVLPDAISAVSAELLAQDARLFGVLDGFQWSESYDAQVDAVARSLAENPDAYRRLISLAERLAALAGVPADDPRVDRLVEDWADALAADPSLVELGDQVPHDALFGAVLEETAQATLSPAQLRVVAELRYRSSGGDASQPSCEGSPQSSGGGRPP